MGANTKVRDAVVRTLHGLTIGIASGGAFAADLPVPVVGNSVSFGAATQVQQGTNLTINQISDRATLNWQSFDIAANHSVQFNQPSATAVALNRIFQNDPSKIFGSLTANGQIYLINRNGILFGNGAQVNVNSLVASTLDVSDDVHERLGIVGAINDGVGRAALEGSGAMGKVEVEAGARLSSASGGRVMLVAPEVINRGVIDTPAGQAIIAATSDKVYLAASGDSDLRGLVVEVGTGGSATNLGEIIAERGNVSIVGLAVNQSGIARATTSVNVNGSIHLFARDSATIVQDQQSGNALRAGRTGELTLGAGSVTEVAPELSGEATAVDAQPQPLSLVKAMARDIEMKSGARITARGGEVLMQGTRNPSRPADKDAPDNDSRVRIESGAIIDVSGLDSAVESVARNIVTVEARGNELRDSPLQRDGVLRGEELYVDMRKGTDLLDISGAVAGIRRSLDERLATGGTVALQSEGHLDVASGARLDLSGGKVTYTAGTYRTSRLITANNRIVEISDADPNTRYIGIAGDVTVRHERWGVTENFSSFGGLAGMQFEEGYVEGKDAGSLQLAGRTMAFGGDVVANTVAGRNQRKAPTAVEAGAIRPYDQRPLAADLTLRFGTAVQGSAAPELILQAEALAPQRNPDGSLKDPGTLVLGRNLFESGTGHLALESTGNLTLAEDLALNLPQFGSLSLTAGRIDIRGDVTAQGGSISANAGTTRTVALKDVDLNVSSGSRLDVAGVWINDSAVLNPTITTSALAYKGGSVSLSSGGDLTIAAGSAIDAGGGAWLGRDGKLVAGDGGKISLALTSSDVAEPGKLTLGGDLSAFALSKGGQLSLTAPGFQIGTSGAAPETPETSAVLSLHPDFFSSGGFSAFNLSARQQGIKVAADTRLLPVQQNFLLRDGMETVATGAALESLADRLRLPDFERRAVDLSLTSRQRQFNPDAGIAIEDGAVIGVEAGGKINLSSDSSIHLVGHLSAPAGTVTLTLNPFGTDYLADQKIWLGSQATISALGTTRLAPDPFGLRLGEVLSGGSITMIANRGSIVLNEGSLLDVSGTAHVLDLPDHSSTASSIVHTPVNVDGAAGKIALTAAEAILAEGELRGRASGIPGSRAGSISVTLDARGRDDNPALALIPFPHGSRVVQVGDTPSVSVARSAAIPSFLNGYAFLDSEALRDGGFAQIDLTARPTLIGSTSQSTAEIRFAGEVTLDPALRLTLDAPIIRGDDANVSLRSAYVAIGSSDTEVRLDGRESESGGLIQADPTAGNSRLRVQGGMVELVGDAVLQGFGATRDDAGEAPVQIASSGDLRLRGTRVTTEAVPRLVGSFRAAGDIVFSAAQIYPTTLSEFTLAVEGAPESALSISSSVAARAEAPLSGGGTLTVKAPVIEQDGVLRAPFGSISLEAERLELGAGSLTSTSGAGLSVLFGQTQLLKDLVFPLELATKVLDEPIEKSIRLDAPDVDIRSGALIDVSGGGDLIATEFVPGPGGSGDILAAGAIDGAFAIIPTLRSSFAPYDPLDSPRFAGQIGSTIYLAGGGGVPAGEYAVLPARYALLGGYLVTPVQGTIDLDSGQALSAADGFAIVAGKRAFAGSDVQESRWSGYKLEPASFVRQRAEYAETKIDSLFAGSAGGLTRDSGTLTIEASRSLNLAGSLAPQVGDGLGPRVDIVADSLSIVSERSNTPGVVELMANDLSRFGAASLLIGGTRSRGEVGTDLTVAATNISVQENARVAGAEIILAARESIDIADNAQLTAAGAVEQGEERLLVSGDSAIASVSTRRPLTLERSNTSGALGTVTVGGGALVSAPGSILLDATSDSTIRGTLESQDGLIALGASVVTLGDASAETAGLVLSNAALDALKGTDLQLRSNSTINLVGDVALELRSFTADAAGLLGSGNENQNIRAGSITLANRNEAISVAGAAGTGTLTMLADELIFDEGAFGIGGYDAVSLRASQAVIGRGKGTVSVAAPTEIFTPVMISENGANTGLEVLGSLALAGTGSAPATTAFAGLGSSWTITADSVALSTRVLLPSGQMRIGATGAGGITLADGASINVAGVDLNIAGQRVATPGGRVALTADVGDVRMEGSSAIDVSGASGGGEAGGLKMVAAQGAIQIADNATLRAASSVAGSGSFEADAVTFGNFAVLSSTLNAGSFNALRAFRQREGNLVLGAGDLIRSGEVALTADNGSIMIAGAIDASRAEGGRVEISASGLLTLAATGNISARATQVGASGGSVHLSTASGSIVTEARTDGRASIDVSGLDGRGASSATGYVHVTAPRLETAGAVDIAVERFDGRVAGARRIDLEALKIHDASLSGLVDNSLLGQVRSDNDALAAGFAPARRDQLHFGGNAAMHLIPGVEIRSSGSLDTGSQLDLSAWREGGQVGYLRFRAGEDLTVSGSISDGFAEELMFDFASGGFVPRVRLQAGDSWSYSFVAGADFASASNRAVVGDAHELRLLNDVVVRTGTGSIDIASSSDIRLASPTAAIYTAGQDAGVGALSDVVLDFGGGETLPFGELFLDLLLEGGELGRNGGNIDIRAQGSFVGVPGRQLITDWLPRLGGSIPDQFGEIPAYWAVTYDKFQQGVGALGGGNLSVRVGGDLSGVSLSVPTTGKAVGDVRIDQEQVQGGNIYFLGGGETEITGRGTLAVDVGGDILGGAFYIGEGSAKMRAGGSIGPRDGSVVAPVLALGNATIDIQARTDLSLEAVLNPTVARSERMPLGSPLEGFFFSYGENSSVSMRSLAGDIDMKNRLNEITRAYNLPVSLDQSAIGVYPGTVVAHSYGGDTLIGNQLTLFPTKTGRLEIIAAGDLIGSAGTLINQSDADTALLPSVAAPIVDTGQSSTGLIQVALNRLQALGPTVHAAAPVHLGDDTANLIAAGGSIFPRDEATFAFYLAKQSSIFAGEDIGNFALRIQHNNAGDVSVLSAGGSILQPTQRTQSGSFSPETENGPRAKIVEIAGGGRFDILAGGTIDLGTSLGIRSVGDTRNPVLADSGASISVLAGLGPTGADWSAFADEYLGPTGPYAKQLDAYLEDFESDPSLSALENFRRLPFGLQRPLTLDVFFQELRESGVAAAKTGVKAEYERGFDAIATLFPGESQKGDLVSLLSQITTLDGGDINLLVPGGLVNAGVASASIVVKRPEELGIVAQRDGDINAYVRDDFIVNQSRVFALDGGDITIWSSKGDIDAGRGAKTALAVPPPRVSFDLKGNLVVEFPPSISGSGIRGAVSTQGRKAGDVFLFAPTGVVDAGDAGIGSAGNVTIGATEVIGADNIDVGGVGVGLPVDTGGLAAGLTNVSSVASGATNAASEALESDSSKGSQPAALADSALSWLEVFVIGLGEESCRPDDAACLQRQK